MIHKMQVLVHKKFTKHGYGYIRKNTAIKIVRERIGGADNYEPDRPVGETGRRL